jgi:hypothetical protein
LIWLLWCSPIHEKLHQNSGKIGAKIGKSACPAYH